jgi:transcriptional regulator with XRE-family HTH domain
MATTLRSDASSRVALGELLREWRKRRHHSQLSLALQAGISQRHLSFVESGRSQPSRDMVVLLAEQLDIPLRERNRLLISAGFAPLYPEHALDDPALDAARRAIERVLQAHEPYPALAIDRHWNLVAANHAVQPFMATASPALLAPPINVLRLSLHPEGLAPRIANFAQWRSYLLRRIERETDVTGDPFMRELLAELKSYTANGGADDLTTKSIAHADDRVFVPLQLTSDDGLLTFISTTTVFGTPVDVTVAEIALECMFPADDVTANYLRKNQPA